MKTIVALYDAPQEARNAVRDLEASGFDRTKISLIVQRDVLGNDESDGEATATGAAIGAGFGILAGLAAVTVPGVGVVAAIGPIIAGGILGAVAGGLVGSLVDAGVPADEARVYEEGVRRGGTLVALSVRDEDAPRAVEIMSRHNPIDLNERILRWRKDGWTPGVGEGNVTTAAAVIGKPDAAGTTTLGDEAVAMPAPTMAIPAPHVQPTREVDAREEADVSAVPASDDFSRLEPDFRSNFQRTFPGSDYTYEQCKPAYHYGYELAARRKGADWEKVEPEAAQDWERREPGTWERMKDAARYAYERARQKT